MRFPTQQQQGARGHHTANANPWHIGGMRSLLPVAALVPLLCAAAPDAGPTAAPPPDPVVVLLERALALEKLGDGTGALKAAWDAVDAARLKAPLEVHTGRVLDDYPQNLGMYREATGGMAFGDVLLLYAEVDNHGLRPVKDGLETELWTDVFILTSDGEKIGGKDHFGEHRFTARTAHRTTHLVLEVAIKALPPDAYQAEVVVHDAVGGKVGRTRIPFRVAAKPGRR